MTRRTNLSRITPSRRKQLIRDLIEARMDLVGVAENQGVDLEELAAWVAEPDNRRCLEGLCLTADVQTQLHLSRYRLFAATRLIRLAIQEEQASQETARRACVDLLRLDLKRVQLPSPAESSAEDANAGFISMTEVEQMRRAFYADLPEDRS